MKPCTLPMLRAACAIAGGRLPFEGKSFVAMKASKKIFISLQVVQGLERRGLVKVTYARRNRKRVPVSAALLQPGRRLVRANPPLCIGCGCTDAQACPEGCSWVAPGWCSACDEVKS